MGALACQLAEAFEATKIPGWRCHREAVIFSKRLAARYGFRPAVDLLLEGPDQLRVAVELEVSRADPVANQVKFLLAHREGELGPCDALVSMFSPAIVRGRRCISSVFARHLRQDGVAAFQVSLLPHLDPPTIQRLNKAEGNLPAAVSPKTELARVISVVEPQGERVHRIHFAGDVADVIANVWTWNDEIVLPQNGGLWGQRRMQFFVHDPVGGEFAPAKFCAFIPAAKPGAAAPVAGTMTIGVYEGLGEKDPRFDGHRARTHLVKNLAFESITIAGSSHEPAFRRWAARHAAWVQLREPVGLLLPPPWFA